MIYRVVTLSEVIERITPDQPCAFDTETLKLYDTIRLAQFYQADWDCALLVEYPDPLSLMMEMSALSEVTWVLHQAAYDITTLQIETSSRFIPKLIADTLLLGRLAVPELESHSLDSVMESCIGFDPYKDAKLDKKAMQKCDWKGELTPDQLLYAAIDVYYLLEVYYKVRHEDESLSYQLDIKSLRYALDFQWNGLLTDQTRINNLRNDNLLAIEGRNVPINVNSYRQVRNYLNIDKSDGLTLAKLAYFGNVKADDVIKTKSDLKINSFLKKFDTPDGRVYGKFKPGAKSGRFNCEKQNLQQIPNKTKGCFTVPDGYVMGYADFSQLELRTIASLVGDSALCNIFYDGRDAHATVAESIFGSGWTKKHRKIAKTINFNGLYGGGAAMMEGILLMQAGLWLELDEVKLHMRRWKNFFVDIADWQQRGIRAYNKGELGQTPAGRRYKPKLMTDFLNIQNQGYGADVAKLAMLYLKSDLEANESKLVNFVHDSYIMEIPDDPTIYKEVAKRTAEAMRESWFKLSQLGLVKDIPMPVEVCIGKNWGDIENTEDPKDHIYYLEVN